MELAGAELLLYIFTVICKGGFLNKYEREVWTLLEG